MFKKANKIPEQSENQISLLNDYGDLKFSLFLGEKSQDGWVPYHCAFFIHNFGSGKFDQIYSTASGSIVSETQADDFKELASLLETCLQERSGTRHFLSESKDFQLAIECTEDVYRVTSEIDLCSMNKEKLEAGHGDSLISLKFNCSNEQITAFHKALSGWLGTQVIS